MKVWTSLEDERNKVPAWIAEQMAYEARLRERCAEHFAKTNEQYQRGKLTTGEYIEQLNRIHARAVAGMS